MYFPAKTALVIAGLVLASPSFAEIGLDAESLATVQMGDTEVAAIDPMLSNLESAADEAQETTQVASEGGAPADPIVPAAPEIAAALTEPGAPEAAPDLSALAPEFFLDPNEGETAALIAADLARAGELTTGSLAVHAAEPAAISLDDPEASFSFSSDAALPQTDSTLDGATP